MIVGICSVRNEVGIVGSSLRHLLEQGIDHVIVSDANSTDGTRDLLWSFGDAVTVYTDDSFPFIQEAEMTFLASKAGEMGTEWVVPFDADEFPYAVDGGTVAEALRSVPAGVAKLFMRVYRHHDWDRREVEFETPRKVVFRWTEGATLTPGQHDVSVYPEGSPDLLAVRELKYRDFDHFRAKIAAHLETMRPEWGPGYAAHVQQFRGVDDDAMRRAWATMMAVPTTHDPIPSTLHGLVV